MKKLSPLLFGTILLSSAGLLSSFFGFFYRIWLARMIGDASLGVFQMILPVFGLSLALCTSGIQTAISRFTAEALASGDPKGGTGILVSGLLFSLTLSVLTALLLYRGADFLARHVLNSSACASLFPGLAFMLPFASVHACIGGYYLGRKNAAVSAGSQLAEQCVRILATGIAYAFFLRHMLTPDARLPVIGMAAGEAASFLFVVCALAVTVHNIRSSHSASSPWQFTKKPSATVSASEAGNRRRSSGALRAGLCRLPSFSDTLLQYHRSMKKISAAAFPLTMQRVLTGALGSLEAVLLPLMLQRSGLSSDTALGIYGVFSGMAMPCIFFPSAITNSLASMLMPIVAEANVSGDRRGLDAAIKKTAAFSVAVGFLCFLFFLLFGGAVGTCILGSSAAGDYLRVLAWLCPFLYLNTTLGSVLIGLGRSGRLFFISIFCSGIRLVSVLALVPAMGMQGYLLGMLFSTILQTLLCAQAGSR